MRSVPQPTVLLVHGAFTDSSIWNGVAARLLGADQTTLTVATPLRSLDGDAEYLRHVIRAVDGPVLLVGHSYGGMVITEAASVTDAVVGLVYVSAFTPETGESAFELMERHPGSTLRSNLTSYPVADGEEELLIRPGKFPEQFAADISLNRAALLATTQRPITRRALEGRLQATVPAWMRWTSRAVLVIWAGADGSSRRAWVWASAVDRLDP